MRLSQARCLCAVLFTLLFATGSASLLSNFTGPEDQWVVSPAEQKQWWGRWPGACGGVRCIDQPTNLAYDGLRFPVSVYGDLVSDPHPGAAYNNSQGQNCNIGLQQAMAQRFATYNFTCGYGGFTPDIRNGPCPDMRLVMLEAQEPHACLPLDATTRTCNIITNNSAIKVNCTDGLLCPNDIDLTKPTGEYDYEVDGTLKPYCATADGPAKNDVGGEPFSSYLGPICGTAYMSFGKYEAPGEPGDPPCDKDGPVEPGMGAGKNKGRCAIPCVSYRAYDERYWAAGQAFCPCLAARNMLPSVLRESPGAATRASKFRYFVYHTEFAMSFDAAGAALTTIHQVCRPKPAC